MNRKILLLSSFVIPFLVYILTIVPGITFTDSGELMGAASTFGVAHPTGYPLFTLLAYLWHFLPLPIDAPLQFNIFAALCTAASASFFFLSAEKLLDYISKKKDLDLCNNSISAAALSFSLLYAFTATIWHEALAFEVYPLQNLMINLIIFLAMRAVLSDYDIRKYIAVTFVLGLAFANHMTSILLVPALLFLFFKRPDSKGFKSVASTRSLILIFAPLLFGAAMYLILPIRSSMSPEFDWGGVSRSFDKFWYHVSGKQYQVWMFSGADAFKENLGEFFSKLLPQYAYIGFIPVLLGLWFGKKYSGTLLTFLLLLATTCIFYASNYDIHDIDAYYSLAYTAFALISVFSVPYFIAAAKSKKATYFMLLLPMLLLVFNFSANNRSNEVYVPEYTQNLIDNLEPNAIIISAQWDYWCSAFWYLQKVQGVRKDVVLIEKELLRRTWYLDQLQKWYPEVMSLHKDDFDSFLEQLELFESGENYDPRAIQSRFEKLLTGFVSKHISKRPIYITADILQTEPYLAQAYEKIPQGFALRLEEEHKTYPVSCDNINISKLASSLSDDPDHLELGIKQSAVLQLVYLARYANLQNDTKTAKDAYSKALQIVPSDNAIAAEAEKIK